MRKPYFPTKNLTVTLKFHCCVTILTLIIYIFISQENIFEKKIQLDLNLKKYDSQLKVKGLQHLSVKSSFPT